VSFISEKQDVVAPVSTELPQHEYEIMYRAEEEFWWYVGMRRHLLTLLEKHWDWQNQPNPLVVDAGCGTGAVLQRLADGFGGQINTRRALGFDLSQEALRFCSRRGLQGRISRGSITNIPLADQSVDIVVSFDVVCYLPDPEPSLYELARILKHGGMLVLNLPAYQFLHSEHDLAVNVLKRYTREQARQMMARHGLMPERTSYVNTVLFPPAAAVRLAKKAALKIKPGKKLQSELELPHPLINRILTGAMASEAVLLKRSNFNLPFGLSLMTVARKL
jgi:SAM-dependent methyltransferase